MTHGDVKLDIDNGYDEKHRTQNEISSDRVEEYAFPSICSLELDSPVQAKYQAIETYDRAFTCHLKRMLSVLTIKNGCQQYAYELECYRKDRHW